MKILNQSFSQLVACVTLLLALGSCSGGGSSGGDPSSPPAPAAGSVTITGTVSGTVIKVVRADRADLISQADTAPLPGRPPFPFTLSNIPVGVPLKVFFFSAGQTLPLHVGNPQTNVFTVQTLGSIVLGFVTLSNGIANPSNQPSNVFLGNPDPSIPPGIEPPPATLTVATPAPATGSIVVGFAVQNFSIGGQGQQHLHIRVDGGSTRHFFNGQAHKVLDDSEQATSDVQWQTSNSFLLNSLSVGQHQVEVTLATASNTEFTNPEAIPLPVTVTINNPPSPPAILTITSPSPGTSLPSGLVSVSFTVQGVIGAQGAPHLHIYLDGGAANHFFNAPTNQVLDGNGQPVASIARETSTSFQLSGLSTGPHTIRLVLANAADQDLQNAEANPPTLNIMIEASPGSSTVAVTSGASFLSSPVRITFSVTDFTIGLPGTPHLRFSIDGGPLNDFYNGGSINSDNGVQLDGFHTHTVHWASPTSFDLFGLPTGQHQVRLALVDASNTESPGTSVTHKFNVEQLPTGELQLQSVLDGLIFPAALAQAPDGRIFFNERLTGSIRIINPNWQLDLTPYCEVEIQVNGSEQGLLGLALDPAFSPSNEVVYVYYTAGSGNRVSKLTRSNGLCMEDVILDTLPTGGSHNGGIIHFGPDGKLYVVIGDVENASNAQDITSLAGKILRVNSEDGSAPTDNPFFSHANANAKKVYSLGHRNSFGFTFHPQTGDLWESENGVSDFDEVNRVTRGKNYGWDDSLQSGFLNRPCCINPILALPIIAPTDIVAIPGNSPIYPPAYRNNLLMAAFNDGTIRLVIPNASNPDQPGTTSVAYPGGQGGLVGMMLGSDGYVYVSNHNFNVFDGSSIFRVVPH